MPHENFVTVKECEQKRTIIRKEKHDTNTKVTGIIFELGKKIDDVKDRVKDNEKKNLWNHIVLKKDWENTDKKVEWIKEEIKAFKKILWGLVTYIILSLLWIMWMLLKYIYQLMSNNG